MEDRSGDTVAHLTVFLKGNSHTALRVFAKYVKATNQANFMRDW